MINEKIARKHELMRKLDKEPNNKELQKEFDKIEEELKVETQQILNQMQGKVKQRLKEKKKPITISEQRKLLKQEYEKLRSDYEILIDATEKNRKMKKDIREQIESLRGKK